MSCALHWFRRDLRVTDNPALAAALGNGSVVAVYVHAPEEEGDWAPGAASRWWLHHSLSALRSRLAACGIPLVIRSGPTLEALRALARDCGARAVHWNRLYEPALTRRDTEIKQRLREDGLRVESHCAHLLHEPWTVTTQAGGAYRAFTPFWRACRQRFDPEPPRPGPAARGEGEPLSGVGSLSVGDLQLLPTIRWDAGLQASWTPGEEGATQALDRFLEKGLAHYADGRDRPASPLTSRLSPHLHFGEIGPRQVWQAVGQRMAEGRPGLERGGEAFLRELGWREFAHHVLYHNPDLPDEPLDRRFASFPWAGQDHRAWRRGETGIPLVDAGMRELWHTGWMHNRVRMVVGSLLVKNLRRPWQSGERWFWDTLVDADLANNSLGWQWVAGSGADAAPFFRIFNPVRQGGRFDPEGEYVRRWVPELQGLPDAHIHAPWQAPESVRRQAGVALGEDYPAPVVDLRESRQDALSAFRAITGRND